MKVSFRHTCRWIGASALRAMGWVLAGGLVLAAVGVAGCSGGGFAPAVSVTPPEGHPTAAIGSGNVVSRSIDVRDFSEVDVYGAIRVEITRGGTYSVSLAADDNVIDLVEVSRSGQTLRMGMKPGSYSNLSVRVAVTMPDIKSIRLSDASTATMSGFRPRQLTMGLSGASKLAGRLEAGQLDLSVGQASVLNLGGTAEALKLTASGASTGSLGDLSVGLASISLREASSATVNARDRLDADLRSASSLYYVGNPSLGSITSIEASSLRRR